MDTTIRRYYAAGLAIALLMHLPALASAQEPPERPTVAVDGTGLVERAPDEATVRLAVETFAESAEAAARRNARRIQAVLDGLRELGLSDDQIRTTGYRLQPQYDYYERDEPGGQRERVLVGYRAVNSIEVTVQRIDRVGEVIDAAIAAGANRVSGLDFGLSESTKAAAREAALREAVRQARDEAATIADALGRGLGPVLRIGTEGADVRPVRFDMARAEASSLSAIVVDPTPIDPGPVEVRASVDAVFRLES